MTQEDSVSKVSTEDEISLKEILFKIKDWWHYILSKWLTILLLGIVGGVLGLFYAWKQQATYTATTTFVLETGEKGGGLGAYAGVASMMGIDLGGGGGGIFQGDNILDLYTSRKMIEETLLKPVDNVSKETLLARFIDINKLNEGWDGNPLFKNIQLNSSVIQFKDEKSKRLRDSVIGNVVSIISKNNLSVSRPDKKLSKIIVDVVANDEIFAKRFNEELVQTVNEFYIETKTKKSIENVSILQHKTDSVRAVMNGAIYNAVAVLDATPNSNPTRQVQRTAPAQRSQFSAETNKAILAGFVQNLEMSKLSLMKETPLIQVIDGPVYPLQKTVFGIKKGIILGMIGFGFLTILILTFRKVFKDILEEK